jgi:hypothetical protein
VPELILDLCGSEGAIFFAVQFREKTYSVIGGPNENFVLVRVNAGRPCTGDFRLLAPDPGKDIKGDALG